MHYYPVHVHVSMPVMLTRICEGKPNDRGPYLPAARVANKWGVLVVIYAIYVYLVGRYGTRSESPLEDLLYQSLVNDYKL